MLILTSTRALISVLYLGLRKINSELHISRQNLTTSDGIGQLRYKAYVMKYTCINYTAWCQIALLCAQG